MLLKKIIDDINENKLLHPSQIGFIRGAGCRMNLMRQKKTAQINKEKSEKIYSFKVTTR